MLILSRRKGESIIIDGKIEIKIIDSDDGRVRVGIEAPREIEIQRKEIYELIMKENQEASETNLDLKKLTDFNVEKTADSKKKVRFKSKK